jgi:phage terminase large subunit-like protein
VTRTEILSSFSDAEAEALLYDWPLWARDKQLPPDGDWAYWLILAGRGFGKTRTGAETVRAWVESGTYRRVHLIAPTAADARDVMVEGESGLLAIAPNWNRPDYEPSKRRVTWKNGATATVFSAEEPDRLRGPQCEAMWCDEPASWRYPETWDSAVMGMRLGSRPRAVVTGTPKPVKLIKDLMNNPQCAVTRGSTYENLNNLAPTFKAQILSRYEGTRVGRQELHAEILEDAEGALWRRDELEAHRVTQHPALTRIVVAVDPAISSNSESNETGIIVAGLGVDGQGYVLDDVTIKASPDGWARQAVSAYHRFSADRIIAESNQGGEMVEHTIRTVEPSVPVKLVHASRGKQTRAEPVAALYEQGKAHHVGMFAELEDQLCSWTPGDTSPDRLDALVWGLTELMIQETFGEPGSAAYA